MKFRLLASLFLAGFMTVEAHAATYTVDLSHTTVSFKIRHLLSKTQGRFNKFEGTVDYEPGKPESWKTRGTIDVASIDTNVANRDKHLLSADFFDVEKYPTIEFKSTTVQEATDGAAKLEGTFTMRGVERPIVLDVQILGIAKDPYGNVRAAFSATTKINRTDFGMAYNSPLEGGGLMLGDEVEITLEVEAIENTV